MKIAETQRLNLRELNAEDAQNLFALNNDPEVIRYTGDRPFGNLAEARSFLENYDQYRKFGYGRWAVTDKVSGEFLGWCGLKFDPATGETDIGFRFFKNQWNKGYATEAAIKCLGIGFGKFNLQRIVGRAMKENAASVHVLEKLGMKYESEFDFYRGHAGLIYAISKEKFKTDVT